MVIHFQIPFFGIHCWLYYKSKSFRGRNVRFRYSTYSNGSVLFFRIVANWGFRLRTFADGSQFFTEQKWSNWLVNVVVRGTILFIFYPKECYEFEENSRFIFLLSPYKFLRHYGGVLGSRAGIGIWCAWYDIIRNALWCPRESQILFVN